MGQHDAGPAAQRIREDGVARSTHPVAEFVFVLPFVEGLGLDPVFHPSEVVARPGEFLQIEGVEVDLADARRFGHQRDVVGAGQVVAADQAIVHEVAALIDEVVEILHIRGPFAHRATPPLDLPGHFGLNDTDHLVERIDHIFTGVNGVHQIGLPPVVQLAEIGIFFQQFEEDLLVLAYVVVALRGAVAEKVVHIIGDLFEVAGHGVGVGVGDSTVVDIVVESGIVVPEDVAPLFVVAVGIEAAPPTGVVVEPVGGHAVQVGDHVVDERQHAQIVGHVGVVRRIRHVVLQNEIPEIFPVLPRLNAAVLDGRIAPGAEVLDRVFVLIVVVVGKIVIGRAFAQTIDAPVITIEENDDALHPAYVQVHAAFEGEGMDVFVAYVATALVGIVVDGRIVVVAAGAEHEPLKLRAVAAFKEFRIDGFVVAHFITRYPVQTPVG